MPGNPAIPDFVTGNNTGVAIPAHPEAMRDAPEAFLTEAMRAYGMLADDNRVLRVTRFEPFPGGNSGQKLILSVEYARPESGLPTELFAKFSRDFGDPFRDRRRMELEAEVRLASLSRHPAFPVHVARPCFADFNHETGTGLLVTERIAFGTGNIEPLHPKCMDYEMADPLAHYEAIVSALARLAAAHKSGRLSPELERLFPFDAKAASADLPIELDEQQLRQKVAAWADFAASFPQLMPPSLRESGFFARMERDALALLRHESDVRRFLHSDPDFVALCHWNTNIDNAWFWRDEHGALRCGLLDWGMVRQMNACVGLWGGLSASEPDFLEANLDHLLDHFAAELAKNGGPAVDRDELALHFNLSLALVGLALMMDTPALVRDRMPDIGQARGPRDPLLQSEQVVHGFLHVSTNFLKLWSDRDFGASLTQMLARQPPGTR